LVRFTRVATACRCTRKEATGISEEEDYCPESLGCQAILVFRRKNEAWPHVK